jgi:hypothetical protein
MPKVRVYFVMGSVRKFLDTPSYINVRINRSHFMISLGIPQTTNPEHVVLSLVVGCPHYLHEVGAYSEQCGHPTILFTMTKVGVSQLITQETYPTLYYITKQVLLVSSRIHFGDIVLSGVHCEQRLFQDTYTLYVLC